MSGEKNVDIQSLRSGITAPQALLFDLDGTILDTGALILESMRYAVNGFAGYSYPDEVLLAGVGTPLITQLEMMTPEDPEATFAAYQEHNHLHHDDSIAVFEGIPALLAQVEECGIPCAVVTSKRHGMAVHGLELFGLMERFAFLLGADDVVRAKPDPFPVIEACSRLGVDVASTWYIGDSPHDMKSANDAGALSIAVTWGMFPLEEIAVESPDLVVNSPAELSDLLRSSRSG